MCGILCAFDLKQNSATIRPQILEMSKKLRHRGPDWSGIYDATNAILSHERLAIVDPISGKQPLTSVSEKLIHRHPHIYGDVEATTEDEVKANWEAIKLKEKGTKSVLQGVPRGLPALVKAIRIGDKARGAGFDWDEPQDVWGKIREELEEFEEAQKSGNQDHIEGELGDVLFSLVNFARLSNLDPEMALERTNKKFIYRFTFMENAARKSGKSLSDMDLSEMEVLWNAAKKTTR